MSDGIKKIKIKDLPQTTSISDSDIFIESNNLETYKVTADDIAKYISNNKNITEKYTVTKQQLGLENVNNTSDVNKPISTAQQNALDLKANSNSPIFTGVPQAPTAPADTNTPQIATTAFTNKALSNHNISSTAHDDIRTLISNLTTRLNALADSDDVTLDQLSEIVAYIKSNRSLIDNITTGKVSSSDIVDNLTSLDANKPLSAKQGKALYDYVSTVDAVAKNSLQIVSFDAASGTLVTSSTS